MNYSSKIKQSKEKVYNHAIATKILDLMDRLRLDANKNTERRWIWELLQNAKDVAIDKVSVEIKATLTEQSGELEFSHNGKPFSVDNITFLIEQVSTKERKSKEGEKPKTTGKFGTGFLTTHLLSEKVDVSGVVKEPELPFRKFRLRLDRSARDIEDIIISVNSSLNVLEQLDSEPTFDDYSDAEFNTSFKYLLDSNGVKIAQAGIKDLHMSLQFALIFLPNIKSVSITSEEISYEVLKSTTIADDQISIAAVSKKIKNTSETIHIASIKGQNVSIAVEIELVENEIWVKPFEPSIPKLFCDFPLIGTEDFNFPVIINSSSFNPNEPRNGIYLTDKDDPKIHENKSLFKEAIELYQRLVEIASTQRWQRIHLLAAINVPKQKDIVSETWYRGEVLQPLRNFLLQTPLVDTEDGQRKSIKNKEENNIFFPSASKKEIRGRIWKLTHDLFPNRLPKKDDVDTWYDIIWEDCYSQTLEELTNDIHGKQKIETLQLSLGFEDSSKVFNWLNDFYDLLNQDGDSAISYVINDKYLVIPNQYGIFKKRSELFWDDGIEEIIKDVLSLLGKDIRDSLRDKRAVTISKYQDEKAGQISHSKKEQKSIIDEINRILKEKKNTKINEAVNLITSLFCYDNTFPASRANIYNFSKSVFKESIPEPNTLKKWDDSIWQESDKILFNRIIQAISGTTSIEGLKTLIDSKTNEDTLAWLNSFGFFLLENGYDNLLNLSANPILPNQNGEFKIKDDLFLDNEIDEHLKDISADLGYDVREELLDNQIQIELPPSRRRSERHVADEIKKRIEAKFQYTIDEATKLVFKKLLIWFSKNESKARDLFRDLYILKYKLYDDSEVMENMEKAEQLKELMSEFKITDIEELKRILRTSGRLKGEPNVVIQGVIPISPTRPIQPPRPITKEVLASLGVTNNVELTKALEDSNVADNFVHESTPTKEMFDFVQNLIQRAKDNVRTFLSNQSNYDCTGWEEVANTVIGGVLKNGMEINLVIRPSDNGEVIFYYSSEKDTLELPEAELWIENGIVEPSLLTLGRILKTTGISKIPV